MEDDFVRGTPKKLSDFAIGDTFKFPETDEIRRVTDVGTRVVTYITLDAKEPRNNLGPPYSIVEHVLDEYDMESLIMLTKADGSVPENKDND